MRLNLSSVGGDKSLADAVAHGSDLMSSLVLSLRLEVLVVIAIFTLLSVLLVVAE